MSRMLRFLLISLVLLLVLQQGEARRKILKGRKVITRTYYRDYAIPAWSIVLLIGIAEMFLGALFYVLLKATILDKAVKPRYVPAPSPPPDIERS